nr:PREDICTED: uncharacterized protein LOC108217204 [Daucus carota subsp. sativus]
MESKGNHQFGSHGDELMTYSVNQIMLLHQLFEESHNPTDSDMLVMVGDNSILSGLNLEHIKVWFKKIRCAKELKKEALMLDVHMAIKMEQQLLMENDFLQGVVKQFYIEKEYIRNLMRHVSVQSLVAPELPRSVLKNLKMAANRNLLQLENEYLYCEYLMIVKGNAYAGKISLSTMRFRTVTRERMYQLMRIVRDLVR